MFTKIETRSQSRRPQRGSGSSIGMTLRYVSLASSSRPRAANAFPLCKYADRRQSSDTRTGRSFNDSGWLNPGAVAFFSWLSSTVGLSSNSSSISSRSQNPSLAISIALLAHRRASSPPFFPKHARRRLLISERLRLAQAGSLRMQLRLRAMRAEASRSTRVFFISKSPSSSGSTLSDHTSEGVLSSSVSSSEKRSFASLIFCSRLGRWAIGPLVTRGSKSALSAVK
mmetsp:Transcript_16796/g.38496  ORF Transcript_16796/g.38496 Transcript_16796/m.38496 type:complete len:227 (-) Transcript_16796:421-1101(-)